MSKNIKIETENQTTSEPVKVVRLSKKKKGKPCKCKWKINEILRETTNIPIYNQYTLTFEKTNAFN